MPDSIPDPTPLTARLAYGDNPLQFGDLTVPAGPGPFPVVVFIHGGFWKNSFGLDLAAPQATSAVEAGYATWNVEYRRVGDPGGGFPGTLEDVDAAVDYLAVLAETYPLDLDRVAVVGHSAGGHLAFWIGQRADRGVVPALVVGQAPVADLVNNLDLGGGAVEAFMGASPSDAAADYAAADPAQMLPIVVSQLIIQGMADSIVPPDRAEAYVALVDNPEMIEILRFADADHFDVIDPTHESWTTVLDRLP